MLNWPIFNPLNYYFNYNAIIPAFVALVILTIITYVFFKEKKIAASISFIIYCLSKTIWLSGMAIIYSITDYAIAENISKYYVFFGVAIMPPTYYLLSSSLLNLKNKRRFILINYIIAIAFYIVNLKTGYLFTGMKEYSFGYYPIFNTPTAYLFLLYFYGNVFISFRNLVGNIKLIWPIEERERTKDMVVGFIILHICGIDYLPAMGVDIFPYGYIFLIIGFTYIFNARPWVGIKNEPFMKQREEDIFVFDDNINRITTKSTAEHNYSI